MMSVLGCGCCCYCLCLLVFCCCSSYSVCQLLRLVLAFLLLLFLFWLFLLFLLSFLFLLVMCFLLVVILYIYIRIYGVVASASALFVKRTEDEIGNTTKKTTRYSSTVRQHRQDWIYSNYCRRKAQELLMPKHHKSHRSHKSQTSRLYMSTVFYLIICIGCPLFGCPRLWRIIDDILSRSSWTNARKNQDQHWKTIGA